MKDNNSEINEKLKRYIDRKEYIRIYRTFFNVEHSIKGFILSMSKSFIFIRPDEDFIVDGFTILENRNFDKITCDSWDKTKKKIFNEEGLLSLVYDTPHIDLTNWVTIFRHVKKLDFHVIIESEDIHKDYLNFFIGPIKKVNNKSVSIHSYDPNGKFDLKLTTISFDKIKTLKFGDRYSTTFRKYLKQS